PVLSAHRIAFAAVQWPTWRKCGAELLSAARQRSHVPPSSLAERAITGRTQTRTIRRHVLSAHIKSALGDARIAAAHDADGGCRLLATAFDPTPSVGTQPTDREFGPKGRNG